MMRYSCMHMTTEGMKGLRMRLV